MMPRKKLLLNYTWLQQDGFLQGLAKVKILISSAFANIIELGGGMLDADIGVGWIDQTGTVHFQV